MIWVFSQVCLYIYLTNFKLLNIKIIKQYSMLMNVYSNNIYIYFWRCLLINLPTRILMMLINNQQPRKNISNPNILYQQTGSKFILAFYLLIWIIFFTIATVIDLIFYISFIIILISIFISISLTVWSSVSREKTAWIMWSQLPCRCIVK